MSIQAIVEVLIWYRLLDRLHLQHSLLNLLSQIFVFSILNQVVRVLSTTIIFSHVQHKCDALIAIHRSPREGKKQIFLLLMINVLFIGFSLFLKHRKNDYELDAIKISLMMNDICWCNIIYTESPYIVKGSDKFHSGSRQNEIKMCDSRCYTMFLKILA